MGVIVCVISLSQTYCFFMNSSILCNMTLGTSFRAGAAGLGFGDCF